MVIKVGINGFGRVGRVVMRTCLENCNLQLSAINDPAITIEYMCYLIKFDSTHGKLKGVITHTDNEITIDDLKIQIFHERTPQTIPWKKAEVQYVVESSGMFTNLEKASGHLVSEGVRRVILTAPSVDIPMIILGVNENRLSLDDKVLSCASSTLYCLAPIVKVLQDNFGVVDGFLTSIHAMTPSLKPLDGLCLKGKHWRDHRSIHQNIIPASTGACKALGKIIPQVKDKISGLAFRVPIVNVSVLDISIRLNTHTNLINIANVIERASQSHLNNIISISTDESVSSDFAHETHSCIFDFNASLQLKTNYFKLICWYENEYSYACRVVDSILFSEQQYLYVNLSKITQVRPKLSNKLDSVQQTEDFHREMSVNCDHALISNESTCTALSSDSKSKSSRHFLMNKTYQCGTSGSCPNYGNSNKINKELFNIWKEAGNQQFRSNMQKTKDFVHSCISFSPANIVPNNCSIAQKRLEMVKQEFSKMVHITEDILKKTHSFESNNSKDSKAEIIVINNSDCENNEKANGNVLDSSSQKIDSGDNFDGKNLINETVSLVEKEIKNIDGMHKDSFTSSSDLVNIVNPDQESKKDQIKRNECGDRMERIKSFDEDVASQNLKNGIGDNVEEFFITVESQPEIARPESGNETNIENINNNQTDANDENKSAHDILFDAESISQAESSINAIDNDKTAVKKESLTQIIDDELRKRNIVADNNPIIAKTTIKLKNDSQSNKRLRREVSEPKKVNSKVVLKLKNPNSINLLSVSGNFNKTLLYDKLDSASETDSSNSFDINERKSQVIHINEISGSFEDIARLDKICRIIEVSDELSDQLFSPLENLETEIKNGCWSFRDLCNKIKLDEFCTNVFGSVSK